MRKRQKLKSRIRLMSLLFSLFTGSVCAADLEEVQALIQSGARGLALQVLDQNQPDPVLKPDEWETWEKQRIHLYQTSSNWEQLTSRLQELPKGLTPDFYRWASVQKAHAWIENRDSAKALAELRKLIWNEAQAEEQSDRLARVRQLVIRAYLAGNLIRDAEIAMLRYQQDYGNTDLEWKLLRARVLMRAGRMHEAEILLATENTASARALYYLAQLHSGKVKPQIVYARTVDLAKKKKIPADVRRQLWQVAAYAAQEVRDYVAAIRMLSHAVEVADQAGIPSSQDHLFALSGEDLWKRYQEYGHILGNRLQLLIGNDQGWFTKASNYMDKKPMEAAALYAVLARESASQATRRLAHEQFAILISKKKTGRTLLRHLYQVKENEKLLYDLPESLRHQLADDALSQSDIKLASKLMGALTEPPKGVNALFWKMRRARILIMGGNIDQGIQALNAVLDEQPEMSRKEMDRLMQVLFDLQTVGRHKEAIALFHRIPAAKYDGQLQREVLYWIADSHKALKEYQQAARFYLRSATLLDPEAMDPWSQTAHYHAAEALADAGMKDDAAHIFRRLLRVTKDPGRKVVLRNKLQQLWLKPGVDKVDSVNL